MIYSTGAVSAYIILYVVVKHQYDDQINNFFGWIPFANSNSVLLCLLMMGYVLMILKATIDVHTYENAYGSIECGLKSMPYSDLNPSCFNWIIDYFQGS